MSPVSAEGMPVNTNRPSLASPITASMRPASRSGAAASEVSYSASCRPLILRSSGMNEKAVIVPTCLKAP